eukprot:CAMPEP_0202091054 /NCGR_PEP_ID=MMETSP0964-20121228/45036_1 /ASSEMBLY_ACC=CAM_ASM_000500 /TAXON_ID=4773 /ORGANISM="Schizochytrium aggregatum, Strain ATCC28209" /LENGTH=31 /DNA_ID= /DNA_START= /DNA_END= /DNA_ORIENTATION=
MAQIVRISSTHPKRSAARSILESIGSAGSSA